jgi:hypothetical protein
MCISNCSIIFQFERQTRGISETSMREQGADFLKQSKRTAFEGQEEVRNIDEDEPSLATSGKKGPSKIVKTFEVDNIQILDAEGRVHDGSQGLQLSDETLRRSYETMKLIRAFDNKALNLQRQGRMGTYSEFKGQEAVQVGGVMAIEKAMSYRA